MGASPLQPFAAGASLCSISFGTTFFDSQGEWTGEETVGDGPAAMMDDVVALVVT
jgi:hypothetical protein